MSKYRKLVKKEMAESWKTLGELQKAVETHKAIMKTLKLEGINTELGELMQATGGNRFDPIKTLRRAGEPRMYKPMSRRRLQKLKIDQL